MSPEIDWYAVLGVANDATRDEIVHAYRRLAHASHPDVRPGDPDAAHRFQEVTAAYEVLADAARRTDYDQTRRAEQAGSSSRQAGVSDWLIAHRSANVTSWSASRARGGLGEPLARVGPVRVDPAGRGASDREPRWLRSSPTFDVAGWLTAWLEERSW